jgi:hypothetical protein
MIDLTVFVRRDASLRRIREVAQERAAAGLDITATSPSLGIVAGRAKNNDLITLLKAIKDVTAIKEIQPRRAQTRGLVLASAWTSRGSDNKDAAGGDGFMCSARQ